MATGAAADDGDVGAMHEPVLVAETLEYLAPRRGLVVDCTLGLGGHAEAILDAAESVRLLGLDRDPQALALAARRLERYGDRVELAEASFDRLAEELAARDVERVEGILADLGVSSLQLDTAERGFSFRFEAPLDMRMGRSGPTAADIVNRSSEEDLERIFREYGEERKARRIAREVVESRERRAIRTTTDLKELIARVKRLPPGRKEGRVDPATRVFQALRIAVNRELGGLEALLDQAIELLDQDGRLVVISYHSLEDRIVKHRLRRGARGEIDQITGRPRAETRVLEVLTKKPVRPAAEEVAANPRSRSARLRAARRL